MIFMILPLLSAPILLLLGLEVVLISKSALIEAPIKTCIVQAKDRAITDSMETALGGLRTITLVHCIDPESELKSKTVDAVLSINEDSEIRLRAKNQHISDRLKDVLTEAQAYAQAANFEEQNLPRRILHPFSWSVQSIGFGELGTLGEGIAAAAIIFSTFCIGGIVTVIFIGEFEHRTIETTLIQPSRRAAVAAKAFAATAITMTPFILGVSSFSALAILVYACSSLEPPKMMQPLAVAVLVLTVVSISVFTALIDMYVAILLRGAKLSALLMNLANNTILILAALSGLPYLQLSLITACVPVLNVCVAAKSISEGHTEYSLCAFAFFVMFCYCFLALLLTEQQFTLEDVMTNMAIRLHRIINFRKGKPTQ